MYRKFTGFISKREMYENRAEIESKFDNYDDESDYIDKCIQYNQDKYFKVLTDTIRDGELIYDCLVLMVCNVFDIEARYCEPSIAYTIVNYYLDNEIMMNFRQWLYSDNGPIVKKEYEIRKVFPELNHIESLEKLIEIANDVYGLDLKISGDNQVYSMSFNYDFDRIDIKTLQDIKIEKQFCDKYNIELCEESQKKLQDFNINNETLIKLMEEI